MSGKSMYRSTISIEVIYAATVAFLVTAIINFTLAPVVHAQEKITVFEAMRLSMSNNPDSSVAEYFGDAAKNEWVNNVSKVISADQAKYFFAFSVVIPLGHTEKSADVIYFNPWVDGIVFSKWREDAGRWAVDQFAFLSGEILRRQEIGEKHIVPPWMRTRGTLIENMANYFAATSDAIFRKSDDLVAFLTKNRANDRALSLVAISARMYTRTTTAVELLRDDMLRNKVVITLENVRSALASKKSQIVRSVFPSASQSVVETLVMLPEAVSTTLVGNWFIGKDGQIIVFMTSFVAPRLFMYIDLTKNGGGAAGVMLADWGTISRLTPAAGTK